ncbi:hypothetical protein BLOT_007128 [Blomia tropicalis]|nr:hypothetical protein BLOT_007128 [Blomia tropicalis]
MCIYGTRGHENTLLSVTAICGSNLPLEVTFRYVIEVSHNLESRDGKLYCLHRSYTYDKPPRVFLLGMTRYSSPKPKPVFILFNENELVANFTSNDNDGDQVQLNHD